MRNLAVIPARGGSKRIHRKNIRDFLGKPIIAYSIETALASGLFDEVMVSTEDREIAEIAKKYGAKVPFFRSEEKANDFAYSVEVIDEVKICYEKLNVYFDNICCIFPAAPFISIESLQKGYDLFIKESFDSVRPLVKFNYPIQRALKMENGKVDFVDKSFQYIRSQDLEQRYHDAGQFYWMKYDVTLRGENRGGFEIPETQSQDIDTEEDWLIAELKFKMLCDKKNG